jgi:hypothetical protein
MQIIGESSNSAACAFKAQFPALSMTIVTEYLRDFFKSLWNLVKAEKAS